MNSTLIAARKLFGGEGAHYSIALNAEDLKGVSAVQLEVLKGDGARERFGSVRF